MSDLQESIANAHTIPASWYTSPDHYEKEKNIFRLTWQIAGNANLINNDGDYLTTTLIDEPLLFLQNNGELKGFYNVCSHKATTLLGGCGNTTKIRCPYHGWTYDLDGCLKGTPEFKDVKDFKRNENGLYEFKVEKTKDYIFANIGVFGQHCVSSRAPLTVLNRTVQDFFAPFSFPDHLKFFESRKYNIDCNWKVFVDNYLDGGYHVNYLHKDLAGVINYKEYKTTIESNNVVLQRSPIMDAAGEIGSVRKGEALYYWVFPNIMVNIYEDTMDVDWVVPTGPETCTVYMDFHFSKNFEDDLKFKSMDVAEQIQQEDIAISERVQKGLRSKSYSTGRYSPQREIGIYHFHTMLAEMVSSK